MSRSYLTRSVVSVKSLKSNTTDHFLRLSKDMDYSWCSEVLYATMPSNKWYRWNAKANTTRYVSCVQSMSMSMCLNSVRVGVSIFMVWPRSNDVRMLTRSRGEYLFDICEFRTQTKNHFHWTFGLLQAVLTYVLAVAPPRERDVPIAFTLWGCI